MTTMRKTTNIRGHKIDISKITTNERLDWIKNRDKRNAQRTKRYSDPDYRREKNDIRNKSRQQKYIKDRTALFKILGGFKCVGCGFDNPLALQIEHKNNTGNLDKRRFNRHDQFFRYYITHPLEAIEYLQIMCANCNQIKITQ